MGINVKGYVDNDSNLNGGDTNHNEAESDLLSNDSDIDDISYEDDSDVDEELRSLRAEEKQKMLILGRKNIGRRKQ